MPAFTCVPAKGKRERKRDRDCGKADALHTHALVHRAIDALTYFMNWYVVKFKQATLDGFKARYG
jgi:hypothetical protein